MPLSAGDINQIYNKTIGRDASQAEIQYLAGIGKDNYGADFGPQDLEAIMGSHPEALQKSLNQYGGRLESRLSANDQQILDKASQSINGQFSEAGRGAGSSGMGNSLLQYAQNMAQDRNSLLANFYGQGYSGLLNTQAGQGQAAQNNLWGNQNALVDFHRQQDLTNRSWGMQQQAYSMQNRANQQNALIGGAFQLGGAVLGAGLGGGFGMAAGSALGSTMAKGLMSQQGY